MARILYTVENLVEEVRSQLDEDNQDSIDTDKDILPSLNRANDYAFDVYARRYPEPILQYATLPLVGGQAEYSIPENVFEDRVSKLEIFIPSGSPAGTFRELQRISYRDLTVYETASSTNIPYYYVIYGRTMRLVPTPTGTYNARMWYLRNPEKLVMPQGRITVVNAAQNYCIVDSIGSSVTTEADQLGSYVNWIDGQSGEIKATLQIQSLADNKIAFRTTPARSTIFNRTVTGDMSSFVPQLDDYVCSVEGTCVVYFGRPTSNFLIEYSVNELTRKLGGESDKEKTILDKFEKQIESTWSGREITLRIKKRSMAWGTPIRRWYWE